MFAKKSEEFKSTVLRLHAERRRPAEIATLLNCGLTVIRKIIKEARKPTPPPPSFRVAQKAEKTTSPPAAPPVSPPAPPAQITHEPEADQFTKARVKQLWVEGKSAAQIAKLLSMGQPTINQILISLGTKERPLKAMHDERMMNLRNLGKSYRQVARAMGLSSSCVHKRTTRMKSKKHDP